MPFEYIADSVQAIELDADQMGLQRSEHLRELYESLSAGEDGESLHGLSYYLFLYIFEG